MEEYGDYRERQVVKKKMANKRNDIKKWYRTEASDIYTSSPLVRSQINKHKQR